MSEYIGRRTFVEGTAATLASSGIAGSTAAQESNGGESGTDDATDTEGEGMTDDTTLIAHRGFAGVYPENTELAVEAASFGGPGTQTAHRRADMVEVDVVPTADGTLVTFHDNGLAERDGGERGLTDTEGLVFETDTDTVTNATVLGTEETVPTLETVMDAIPPSVAVNLEFKNPGSDDLAFAESLSDQTLSTQRELWRPYTERALDLVSEYDNDILVSSFYEAALATVRDYDDSVPVAFLFWDSIEEGLEVTRRYDCDAMNVPRHMVQGTPFFNDSEYIDSDLSDIDLVDIAADEDRALNTWTVGTWYQARELVQAGVDGLISDYPTVLSIQD
ncbi:glycerophosphoryl diester phosphodiesterase [Haloarcula quadrata]|jgi:glycerophosphoryl diester phosphodiesterase|uniref:Glycerophosphodiester phosphodiesterase n=2 Tax=Haloarcula TaxID=2237 RepID=M0K6K9_9EURY|nr:MULTISPECIES: glycerophosphodiester phosphodiesterase [Haloarcula]EMA15465.1 glycerophosphoryl diester phosphodiesterase [Haloarcula sinaiiensis ATCC 33800]QUJ72415.1 glycerophosphodiester phosphodiesterase [Haloarcula sinaiiensis ATCC 33800]RKS81899.1 glycerophosphoryl diester phosphodiesterase [Haloarcula quadrata]